jgi:predicted GIY-YIG superfamily endonuclease
MKPIGTHNYFVYITTNKNKTVLYTGVTNDLRARLSQHLQASQHFSFVIICRQIQRRFPPLLRAVWRN